MKKIVALLFALLFISTSLVQAASFDPSQLPEAKRTLSGKYLSAKEAYEMVEKNPQKVLFVDVRTPAETMYVGLANQVNLNIPYMLNDYSTWDGKKNRFQMNPNSDFTTKIADAMAAHNLKKSDPVILICRSGDRSASAANLLTNAGYTNVYSVYDGFEGDMSKDGRRTVNGWKNANLPWGYTLDQSRAYFSM